MYVAVSFVFYILFRMNTLWIKLISMLHIVTKLNAKGFLARV